MWVINTVIDILPGHSIITNHIQIFVDTKY